MTTQSILTGMLRRLGRALIVGPVAGLVAGLLVWLVIGSAPLGVLLGTVFAGLIVLLSFILLGPPKRNNRAD